MNCSKTDNKMKKYFNFVSTIFLRGIQNTKSVHQPTRDSPNHHELFACWVIFSNICFLLNFQKIHCFHPFFLLIYNLNVKQFGSQMKPHILWGFIWIQIVCKVHQWSSKFTASGLRVKIKCSKMLLSIWDGWDWNVPHLTNCYCNNVNKTFLAFKGCHRTLQLWTFNPVLHTDHIFKPLCARDENNASAYRFDPGQPPSNSVACLRSNLLATQSIISPEGQEDFESFEQQMTLGSILRKLPSILRVTALQQVDI